ncbi:MAG: HEAT repeat domain-containing protein [Planctomycetota bacterium]
MSLTSLCLLAVLAPQTAGRQGRLVLPPAPQPVTQRAAPQLSELDRFHRAVMPLRRSSQLSATSRDLELARLRADFETPQVHALTLARTAGPDVAYGLFAVLERYGDAAQVEETLFLLLTRTFGVATRAGMDALVALAGSDAKRILLQCLAARYSGVRKAATDLLLARIDASDLPVLLELSRDGARDIRRKALFLLGAVPHPEAQERLIAALSDRDPLIAATACESLIAHGPDVAEQVQPIVARPATGRRFGYAAFALAQLENLSGKELLDDDMLAHLRVELTGSDTFLRATSALALANLAFRSGDARGVVYGDREIVEGLMLVVAPRGYVSNMSMLQRPAAERLVQFTGVDHRGRNDAWHTWWGKARASFVGTRLTVEVTPENAAGAELTWNDGGRTVRFRGVDAAAAAAETTPGETDEYILQRAEFVAVVDRLKALGLMSRGLLSASLQNVLPVARELDLRLGDLRARIAGPAPPVRWLDALGAELLHVAERERWQLYLGAASPAAAVSAWREERAWLAEHADRTARDRRLVERILAAYPTMAASGRARATRHLLELPSLADVLTEADGLALVRMVEAAPEFDEESFQLAELALMAPGERCWWQLLLAVDGHHDTGGREALPRIFAMLGADRVRRAVESDNSRLRIAAILESAKLRDLQAVAPLLAAVGDPEREVREASIYGLGVLGSSEARARLLELVVDPDIDGATRRIAWVALGRIGGEDVFPLLQSAVAAPRLDDQLAAIQALGELREPRSAQLLAQIFVAHGLNPRGTQAMASLQKLGPLLARWPLRRHLKVRDPQVRREIVQLLAEFQDPSVVPDLIARLEQEPDHARTSLLLAGITGVDLGEINDRVPYMRAWWESHRDLPQASWFLESLRRIDVPTSLGVEDLGPKTGNQAVPELTRILLESQVPHVRVMAAALLRETTDRDFGLISMTTDRTRLQAIADRYRFYAEADGGPLDRPR